MTITYKRLSVIAALALCGYVLYAFLIGQHFQNQSAPRTFTVTLTDRGFQPDTLTIRKGDTVRFVSVEHAAFWPASDPHPTHSLYPAFDPLQPIPQNQSWSFVFDTPGTWGYHDHLSPAYTGTIVVLSPQGKTVGGDACTASPHSIDCWRAALLQSVETQGPKAALQKLADFYRTEPGFPAQCHALAHDIGVASYRPYLSDPSSIVTPDAAYCANGFYHGFMEAFLTATRDPAQAKAFCTYIGQKLGAEAPDAELQCYHGIGHGAMDFAIGQQMLASSTNALKPQELINPALALCTSVGTTADELYRCNSAVFNSLANLYEASTTRQEFNLTLNYKDPLAICRAYSDPGVQDSCYGNMNSLLYDMTGRNFLRAAKYIEQIPDTARATSAMSYLAAITGQDTTREDPEKSIGVCNAIQSRLLNSCVDGLAHSFLEMGQPGQEGQEALSFCGLPGLAGSEKEECFRYVLSSLHGWFSPEEGKLLCASADAQYRHYCPEDLRS